MEIFHVSTGYICWKLCELTGRGSCPRSIQICIFQLIPLQFIWIVKVFMHCFEICSIFGSWKQVCRFNSKNISLLQNTNKTTVHQNPWASWGNLVAKSLRIMWVCSGGSMVLVSGPPELWPERGPEGLRAQNLLQTGFPLKIAWKWHNFEAILGAKGGRPRGPPSGSGSGSGVRDLHFSAAVCGPCNGV